MMARGDLDLVRGWRNHPDIRQFMLTRHEITPEEHQRWFERVSRDPDKHLLIFEQEGEPLGFVHFSGKVASGSVDWGFYTSPTAPKGTGRKLGMAALDYAFCTIGCHKVCGQALAFNTASIGFHLAMGFQQEGVLRQQSRIGDDYHDLICFGLLRQEWLERVGE